VDADFEILDGGFVPAMLAELETRPNLVAMSTDYSRTNPAHFDTYSGEVVELLERWHTWFCIYKRETLRCGESHAIYHEPGRDGRPRRVWDSGARFQQALREKRGFELDALHWRYQACFIHYGGFSKNRSINERNVGLYRRIRIFGKRGIRGRGRRVSETIARLLVRACFHEAERWRLAPGWGQR
jgi:hypothetical protein